MKFINKHYIQILEVKRSKFIAHFIPYTEYETTLKKLKLEHIKAKHFVVAYRYLNEYNQIVEYTSDDGEPKGTSGKPSLMVLQGAEIINSAVIIVRYFGGTKLGTGGLVRAYSDAVNLVIPESELLEYKKEIVKKISFTYSNIRMIDYECLTCGVEIIHKLFDDKTVYELKASKADMKEFLMKVKRLIEHI